MIRGIFGFFIIWAAVFSLYICRQRVKHATAQIQHLVYHGLLVSGLTAAAAVFVAALLVILF